MLIDRSALSTSSSRNDVDKSKKKRRGKDKQQRPKRVIMPAMKHTFAEEQDIFNMLYDLCDLKYTRMAELLFVTSATVRKWGTQGFPNPHWAFVCRWLISRLLKYERTKEGTKHRKKQKELYARFYKLPKWDFIMDTLVYETETGIDMHEATIYVRTLLYSKKSFSMPWHKIKLAVNSGGYSEGVLRRALHACGAVAETTGFGEDKTTIWTLPVKPEML